MSAIFAYAPPLAQVHEARSISVSRPGDRPQTSVAPWRIAAIWAARRRQRLALADLVASDHLLADIGLTRRAAMREAEKPFWRR